MTYLIDAATALVIGTLSGMGIGSGGLLVIYLTAVRGLGQLSAQGCNLLFFVFSSSASLFIHRYKRNLDIKMTSACALLAIGGSYLGVLAGEFLGAGAVRRVFAVFLIIAGTSSAVGLLRKRASRK